jgi:membrane protease YdiL (CAAX protease family)
MYKEPGGAAQSEPPADADLDAPAPSSDGANAYPHDISAPYPTYPAGVGVGQPIAEPPALTNSRRPLFITLGLLGLVLLSLVATLGGAEGGRFLSVGTQFVPVALLAALAYGGVKNSASALFAYLWLAVLGALVLFISLGLTLLVYVKDLNGLRSPRLGGLQYEDVFKPGAREALLSSMLLLAIVAVIGGLMLVRPVRALVSKVVPIDPNNFVHKIALCFLVLVTLGLFVPLIVLGGQPPLLELLASRSLEGIDVGVRPQDILYQFVWMVPAALVAGGWPIARSFQATLTRLGLVRPSALQVGIGVALGVALAAVAAFGLDPAISWLWQAMGWPTTNIAIFGDLMKSVTNPAGAILIGVTAGIGEEMVVRGLLQPRIGLIGSNLVFTAFHALQYGPDGLLSVFLIGLVLGIIRSKSNTTTSAITHGVYDFVLVMASVLLSS